MKMAIMFAAMAFAANIGSAPVFAQGNQPPHPHAPNPQIDYVGFAKLTDDLWRYREGRLIDLDQFNSLSQTKGAIILDTRSAAAFAQGHIEGAVNLPFSDFTKEKLAEYITDERRPILIYCNNNFRDNVAPVVRKAAPLALNIPTFINLYGYGYQNIYELRDVVTMADPRVRWVVGNPVS